MFTALVSMGYFGNSARSYFFPSEVFLISILKALGQGQRQPARKEKMERNCWIPSSLALICFANFEGLKFIFEVQWDLCILNSHVGQNHLASEHETQWTKTNKNSNNTMISYNKLIFLLARSHCIFLLSIEIFFYLGAVLLQRAHSSVLNVSCVTAIFPARLS